MVDRISASAYNSWWQFRADSWSRLEEAAGRIVTSLRRGKSIDQDMTDAVHAQCAALAPLEQFSNTRCYLEPVGLAPIGSRTVGVVERRPVSQHGPPYGPCAGPSTGPPADPADTPRSTVRREHNKWPPP